MITYRLNYMNANTIETIVKPIVKELNLDEKKTLEFVSTLNLMHVTDVGQYLKRVLNGKKDELRKRSINFNAANRRMEASGFTGEAWELSFISAILRHAYNEFPISADEIQSLLNKVIDWCVTQNTKTYKDVINYLKKSKLLNKLANIPYPMLEQQVKKSIEDWDRLCDEIEAWNGYE